VQQYEGRLRRSAFISLSFSVGRDVQSEMRNTEYNLCFISAVECSVKDDAAYCTPPSQSFQKFDR